MSKFFHFLLYVFMSDCDERRKINLTAEQPVSPRGEGPSEITPGNTPRLHRFSPTSSSVSARELWTSITELMSQGCSAFENRDYEAAVTAFKQGHTLHDHLFLGDQRVVVRLNTAKTYIDIARSFSAMLTKRGLQKAMTYFKRAWKVIEDILREQGPNLTKSEFQQVDETQSDVLLGLGVVSVGIDDLTRTEEVMSRALSVFDSVAASADKSEFSPKLIQAVINLGYLRSTQFYYAEAKRLLSRKKGLSDDGNGDTVGREQRILGKLIEACMKGGNLCDAEHYARKNYRICKKISGSTSREAACAALMLAMVLNRVGKFNAAEMLAKEALDILEVFETLSSKSDIFPPTAM